MQKISVKNGVFYFGETPFFFISGDYPYYRDSADNWKDRLQKMKKIGVNVVTFYVPWRHHCIGYDFQSGEQTFDFTGKTQPNRNVIEFLTLIKELGMYAVVKPGPFIHAETDYGGLPDFVNPDNNPKIQPFKNWLGFPNRWFAFFGKPLPSPLDPEFLRLSKAYYKAVSESIMVDNIYPKGPVICLQFLNEGLYSEGNMQFPNIGDYNLHVIGLFRTYLKSKYGSIQKYNEIHGTRFQSYGEIVPPGASLCSISDEYKGRAKLKLVIDFTDFIQEYYAEWINRLKESFFEPLKGLEPIPIFNNMNPQSDFSQGLDSWATRVNPEKAKRLCDINYGYTNWIGAVNYKKSSYLRYSFLCSRYPGVNFEENWGFGKIYDWYYTYGFTPLYQTLLAIASGATGYNVYTAVGTAHWDKQICSDTHIPYPSHSPITHEGKLTNKALICWGLNQIFSPEYFGRELLEMQKQKRITIGIYQPYVYLASFAGHREEIWRKLGFKDGPSFGMDFLGKFHVMMNANKEQYDFINLIESSSEELKRCKTVCLVTMEFMEQSVQEKLRTYVESGGFLILFGEFPILDDNFQSCRILFDLFKDKNENIEQKEGVLIIKKVGSGSLGFHKGNPFKRDRSIRFRIAEGLVRTIQKIPVLKIGKISIHGKEVPYAFGVAQIADGLFNKRGKDIINPKYTKELKRAFEIIDKALNNFGNQKNYLIETNCSNVDIILFSHPEKDVQYIFLFSMQTDELLNISLSYSRKNQQTKVNYIKTKLVGHTAQFLRIENGILTALIYSGFNPASALSSPLNLEINGKCYTTETCVDLALIQNINEKIKELIAANVHDKAHNTLNLPKGVNIKLQFGEYKMN